MKYIKIQSYIVVLVPHTLTRLIALLKFYFFVFSYLNEYPLNLYIGEIINQEYISGHTLFFSHFSIALLVIQAILT